MHLLIPFAGALADDARQALHGLSLPRLDALLEQLTPTDRDEGDEYSLSPPHERAQARALGLLGDDGRLPWAARHLREDGLDPGDLAWGELTPAHWHVAAEQISLGNPSLLGLEADESRELLEAIRPLFEEDGWQLVWGSPTRWYVAHASLADLPCASIDRVIGRNVDLWLRTPGGQGADARLARLRRLQNEVQMTLFQHPLNDRREDRGVLPVNSFWLSGCGRWQAGHEAPRLQVETGLRDAAIAGDWRAWAAAWQALDAGPIAQALRVARERQPLCVELAGERHVQRFELTARSWWSRLGARWARSWTSSGWLEDL